jgi:hypothetical protein
VQSPCDDQEQVHEVAVVGKDPLMDVEDAYGFPVVSPQAALRFSSGRAAGVELLTWRWASREEMAFEGIELAETLIEGDQY